MKLNTCNVNLNRMSTLNWKICQLKMQQIFYIKENLEIKMKQKILFYIKWNDGTYVISAY